jgi:hypothetical protein
VGLRRLRPLLDVVDTSGPVSKAVDGKFFLSELIYYLSMFVYPACVYIYYFRTSLIQFKVKYNETISTHRKSEVKVNF